MIKVIASDMDGTLLCDDHRIAPDTIAAVKEACAAGIRFMVATGRGYEGAMAELDGTGIVCDYILGSGAEVRDPQRKIVKECGIGMELCREICEEVKEFPISIVFLTNEGDYRIGKRSRRKYYSGDAAFSCKYDPGRGRENKRISQGDRKCKGCF